MSQLLGASNVAFPSNEEIHENFTAWQKSCQLVVVEELMAKGRLEIMNKLKPMITQPLAVIREMYKPTYTQDNVYNFLIFTNFENSIVIDENDRRYCIIFSPAEPREAEYYDKLWDWTEENIGAIGYCLQERDLSEFNPNQAAPYTTAKDIVVQQSMPPLKDWLKSGLDFDTAPPFYGHKIVSPLLIAQSLPKHIRFGNPQSVRRYLRELGWVEMRKIKQLGKVVFYNPEGINIEKEASDEAIIALYEKWVDDFYSNHEQQSAQSEMGY